MKFTYILNNKDNYKSKQHSTRHIHSMYFYEVIWLRRRVILTIYYRRIQVCKTMNRCNFIYICHVLVRIQIYLTKHVNWFVALGLQRLTLCVPLWYALHFGQYYFSLNLIVNKKEWLRSKWQALSTVGEVVANGPSRIIKQLYTPLYRHVWSLEY